MSKKEIAFLVEKLSFEMWTMSSLGVIIEESIFDGNYSKETYQGAVYLLVSLLGKYEKKMASLKEKLFLEIREEKGNE